MKVKINVVHEGKSYFGEVELLLAGNDKAMSKLAKTKTSIAKSVVTKPSGVVAMLYGKHFFKEPRKLPDVWNELRKEGYNFSRASILMALKAASYLTMNGRRGSYAFVQKFPPLT